MTPYESPPSAGTDLARMVNEFAQDTDGVSHALLLSVDGLPIAASEAFDRDQVDKVAATSGSLISIAAAMSRELAAGLPEILSFRTPRLHFLFTGIGSRAGLAVLADRGSNLALVGHQMQNLVTAAGPRLDPTARSAPTPQATG